MKIKLSEKVKGKRYSYRTLTSLRKQLNTSQSLEIVGFIAKYINMVKPTEATLLTTSTKAHCNGIKRDQDALLANAFLKDDL